MTPRAPAPRLRVIALVLGCLAAQAAVGKEPPARQPEAAVMTTASERNPIFAAPATGSDQQPKRARFGHERPSDVARHVADWALDSGDHGAMPFVIIDKTHAKVFVFDARGQLLGAAPALLGLAIGDDAVPGIGQRKLSTIRPEERTTSAGRFVAALDRNLQGNEILWVDYDIAMSLHPVVPGSVKERRADRLATASPNDNRISYGCINVPADFFVNVVSPSFTGTDGIVYVLPETRSAQQFFGTYDVDARARGALDVKRDGPPL